MGAAPGASTRHVTSPAFRRQRVAKVRRLQADEAAREPQHETHWLAAQKLGALFGADDHDGTPPLERTDAASHGRSRGRLGLLFVEGSLEGQT